MAKKPTRKFISLSEGEKAYAMSRAVIQGDWCFVSGTVGYDYSKGELPESAAQQTSNAFANIMAAIKETDFELGHTIRVQYTVSDRKYVKEILPVIKQYMGNIMPAATMVIAGMVDEKMKVEVEITAFKGA